MQLFQQMVYNSFFCAVLIVLAWAANKVLGKWYQRTWRYYLWMLIGLRLLIPFDFSLEHAPIQLQTGQFRQNAVGENEENAVSDETFHEQGELKGENSGDKEILVTAQSAERSGNRSRTWMAAGIWLLGYVGILFYFFIGYRVQKRRIRRYSLPVMECHIHQLWKKMLAEEEISESIPIYRCVLVHAPMVIGIRKKALLLPEREFASRELAYIFRHEIQHLKHHDICLKAMYLFLCAVYWFQPAVWLMKHEFTRDLEEICDKRAIKGFGAEERYSYTQTMIQCMVQRREFYIPAASGFGGSVKIMKERVRLIMKGNEMKKGFGIYASLAVLMCVGMLLVSCGVKSGKEAQESKEMQALNENGETKSADPEANKTEDMEANEGRKQDISVNTAEEGTDELPETWNAEASEAVTNSDSWDGEPELPWTGTADDCNGESELPWEETADDCNREPELPWTETADDCNREPELPEQINK